MSDEEDEKGDDLDEDNAAVDAKPVGATASSNKKKKKNKRKKKKGSAGSVGTSLKD
jgi:hypothetical protein